MNTAKATAAVISRVDDWKRKKHGSEDILIGKRTQNHDQLPSFLADMLAGLILRHHEAGRTGLGGRLGIRHLFSWTWGDLVGDPMRFG